MVTSNKKSQASNGLDKVIKEGANTIKSIVEAQTTAKATGEKSNEPKTVNKKGGQKPYTAEATQDILERMMETDDLRTTADELAFKYNRSQDNIFQKYYKTKRKHDAKVVEGQHDISKEHQIKNKKEFWVRITSILYKFDINFNARKDAITILPTELIIEKPIEMKSIVIKLLNLGAEFNVAKDLLIISESQLDLGILINNTDIQ